MKKKKIYKTLARMFDEPCQWSETAVRLFEHNPNYCEKHCGQKKWKCWKKALEVVCK